MLDGVPGVSSACELLLAFPLTSRRRFVVGHAMYSDDYGFILAPVSSCISESFDRGLGPPSDSWAFKI